ncbi:TonB-dependent receptor [Sphingomonas sp. R86520]|uniref:TonB-dependent receptor n=1 Tax=Sphingomonas sp. R86520 TaxID=3093859 RepID=UPI0036D333B5
MMRIEIVKHTALGTTALAGCLFLTPPAAAQDTSVPATGTAAAPPDGLGDIVVTATRTEQSLQRVPVAVTAFSEEALTRLQVRSVKDLSQIAPNVSITQVTGGSAGVAPYVRGGGVTDGANITSEPEVGFYIDDVYQPRSAASFIEALDIERIEVLRGPQGTLYGRNSSSGAIKIITRKPGTVLAAKAEVGLGTWGDRYAKGSISGPVSSDDRWRLGFSGLVRDRDGGRQTNTTLGKKVGAEQYRGFQSELYYAGDRVQARLKGFYSNYKSDGLYPVALDPNTATTDYRAIQPASGSYRIVTSPNPSFTRDKQYGTSLNVTADLTDTLVLSSVTGWSHLTDDWALDFSGGVPLAAIGIPAPGYAALFDRRSESHQTSFSQELQLRGSAFGSFVTYVGGLYYFRESGAQAVDTSIFFTPASVRFGVTTDSYAAFGQVGFHLTPKLTLTLGGRYTEDHKKLDAVVNGTPVVRGDTFKDFLPKADVNYQLLPSVLAYASYSEGFKAGGYNGLADTAVALNSPFAPQKVKAYEIGVKSDFFDHRARVNLSAFINDYTDLQQQLVTDTGAFLTQNYNARHKGIEAELSVRPVRPLTLWTNGVYNDGKYRDSGSGAGALTGTYVGNTMTNVFKYQLTTGADLSLKVGRGAFVLGGNYGYRSNYFATPDNSFFGHVPSTQLVDGYVGYTLDRVTVRLAGKNLTDERYWTTGFGFSVIRPRFLADPRTLRLSFAYKL